jgi:hypothetical protein
MPRRERAAPVGRHRRLLDVEHDEVPVEGWFTTARLSGLVDPIEHAHLLNLAGTAPRTTSSR